MTTQTCMVIAITVICLSTNLLGAAFSIRRLHSLRAAGKARSSLRWLELEPSSIQKPKARETGETSGSGGIAEVSGIAAIAAVGYIIAIFANVSSQFLASSDVFEKGLSFISQAAAVVLFVLIGWKARGDYRRRDTKRR
jgi:hypothetical protein